MKSSLPVVLLLFSLMACMPDEEKINTNPSLNLVLSQDTVLFDTLLSNRGSITRRFKIFNKNDQAVRIDNIYLGRREASNYSLIINGKTSTQVTGEVLLGGDSLQVLVSVFVDPQDQNLPYLVKDSVVFEWNQNQEHVKLVSWGQDAVFVNADTLCDVTWTADRPYVIYNYALVDTLCTLNVEAGARIFLDNSASLFVKGTLSATGTPDERITIKNTRFDAAYEQAPGQWDGIYFLEGSLNNQLNYCDITNGSVGLRIGTPDENQTFDLVVNNSTIGHMSNAGILAFTSEVLTRNTLVYNCGQYLVGNFAGGRYQYDHCTFSNFPNFFFREEPSVQFSDNVVLGDETVIGDDLDVTMRNTIIWGTQTDELLFADGSVGEITLDFQNGILKSTRPVNGFFISQESNFPGFARPQQFDFTLDSSAFAIDRGVDIGLSLDLRGDTRTPLPDIGAYEYLPEE